MSIFLLQTEPGAEGEFEILGVYSSLANAELAQAHYAGPYVGSKGKPFQLESEIVQLTVDSLVLPTLTGARRIRPTPDVVGTK